jgi:hydrogenase nickel incorporation protein HypA/HybF
VPESLDFCFGTIISDTPLSGARLDIEITAIRSLCNACRLEFVINGSDFLCPTCGGSDTELLTGTELQVLAIEINENEQEVS